MIKINIFFDSLNKHGIEDKIDYAFDVWSLFNALNGCLSLAGHIADTAGICITKAMNRPLTGGTAEAAAKPWLIPAGKYFAAHHLQGQHPLQVVLPLRPVREWRRGQ